MGGRGSSSGFTAGPQLAPQPQQPAVPKSASETNDLNELKTYMANIGISVDASSLAGQTFENVRDAAAGIERIVTEFPQAKSAFNRLRGENLNRGVLACASYSGNITLANHYYSKSENDLGSTYSRNVSNGFHPDGTTKTDIATHEAGHILEKALIYKNIPGRDSYSQYDRRVAWGKCQMASKVISEACKAAKKTPAGKGMENTDLISSVSRYATKNRSETLAECVADYSANGTNAKPLSVAVWNILKRELG